MTAADRLARALNAYDGGDFWQDVVEVHGTADRAATEAADVGGMGTVIVCQDGSVVRFDEARWAWGAAPGPADAPDPKAPDPDCPECARLRRRLLEVRNPLKAGVDALRAGGLEGPFTASELRRAIGTFEADGGEMDRSNFAKRISAWVKQGRLHPVGSRPTRTRPARTFLYRTEAPGPVAAPDD